MCTHEIPNPSERYDQFRHKTVPFLHIVEDPAVCREIFDRFSEVPHGMEVGCGFSPVRYWHIDHSVLWLAAEPDGRKVKQLIRLTGQEWIPDVPDVPDSCQVFILKINVGRREAHNAKIIVYCNPDYNFQWLIKNSDLRPGQRLIYILNGLHAPELEYHREYLSDCGYDPALLRLQTRGYHPFGRYGFMEGCDTEYILDYTKD